MPFRDVLLAVLVAAIWGFNFVVIKVGLDAFPPLFFSALRFTFAAFPAVLLLDRGNVPWRAIVGVGLSLGVVMFSLLFLGMHAGMPPGLSSLVLQCQAVFTAVLAAAVLGQAILAEQVLGFVVAFAGFGLIGWDIQSGHQGGGQTSLPGFVLVIGSAMAWAVSNILTKQAGKVDMLRLTIWMCLVPPLPLLGLSAIFESHQLQALARLDWLGAGAVLYTAWLSSLVGYGLWNWLLRRHSPGQVAPFSLLVPVFGMLSAYVCLGETLSPLRQWASLLAFAGVLLNVYGRPLRLRLVALLPERA